MCAPFQIRSITVGHWPRRFRTGRTQSIHCVVCRCYSHSESAFPERAADEFEPRETFWSAFDHAGPPGDSHARQPGVGEYGGQQGGALAALLPVDRGWVVISSLCPTRRAPTWSPPPRRPYLEAGRILISSETRPQVLDRSGPGPAASLAVLEDPSWPAPVCRRRLTSNPFGRPRSGRLPSAYGSCWWFDSVATAASAPAFWRNWGSSASPERRSMARRRWPVSRTPRSTWSSPTTTCRKWMAAN